MPWTNPIDYVIARATCVARLDTQILSNIDFAGSHGHSGSAGDGAALSSSQLVGQNSNQNVYQYITVLPFLATCKNNATLATRTTAINNALLQFDGGVNTSSALYDVSLDIGTWTISARFSTFNSPIASGVDIQVDGTVRGFFNPDYTPATNRQNVLTAASSFSISTSGLHSIKFLTSAACSGAAGKWDLHHFELRRLSA